MTKVMLWPDIYREQGHWLPTVSLARKLLDAGYAPVEFMGIPDCESIVSPYGGTFNTILSDIYPLGHSVNDTLEPIGQRWKPHHLLPLARGALDSLFTGAGKPDLLIAGYFAGLEALILHRKYQVPLVTITTYLRHPDEDPAIFAKGKLVYMPEPQVTKIIESTTGNADMTLDEFVQPLLDSKEIIACPRDFDFFDEDWDHSRWSDVHQVTYVEPMMERKSLDGTTEPPDNPPSPTSSGKDDVYHPIPTEDVEIIYATSGSQVDDYLDKARQFFLSLIAMMKTQRMQDHHLVLAVGDKLLQEFRIRFKIDLDPYKNELPSNVSIAAWVSQQDILKRAKVVFMHGGLATIKESIWEKVPIVILPHGKDQMENALRVRRAGVGIAPSVGQVTPQVLRRMMTEVTANRWIKGRIAEMQEYFDEEETNEPSVAVIQGEVPA